MARRDKGDAVTRQSVRGVCPYCVRPLVLGWLAGWGWGWDLGWVMSMAGEVTAGIDGMGANRASWHPRAA